MLIPIENITMYPLSSKHAETKAADNPTLDHFIHDTSYKPFQDDVIRVLEVYSTNGQRIALNDIENPSSVFTTQPTVLQIPFPIETSPISLGYQARHLPVPNEPGALIDIPATMEKLLSSYIAHLVYSHMNGQEHSVKSAEHLGTYDRLCAEIEEKDLVSTSQSTTNTKFAERGFV
jgi:predicted metalloenzyme YecM